MPTTPLTGWEGEAGNTVWDGVGGRVPPEVRTLAGAAGGCTALGLCWLLDSVTLVMTTQQTQGLGVHPQ